MTEKNSIKPRDIVEENIDWATHGTEDLIKNNILFIGDGYRAKNSELSKEGIPFARAGNINNGFNFSESDNFPLKDLTRVGNKISKENDVVFTSKGTVGRFAFVKKDTQRFVYSPQLCFWRVLNDSIIDPKFLYCWLRSSEFESQYRAVKGLTDMADYVSLADQRKMFITLPPLPTQKKIAKVLGDLDDKIELNRRMNETLEEMAMAVYRHYFVHFGLPPGAKEEATECPFGKLIEHPEMGMIPEGWSVGKLGDVVNTISGGTPSRNNDLYFLNANIKWVKSKELHGGFIFDTEEKITEDALKNSAAKLLPENSILIALYGATVGEYAILANEATCNQAVCALIPNTDLPFTYLFIFIKSNKENFKNLAIGSAQQNISQILIKNQFLIIDKKAIRVYHERVRKIFALIKSNSQEIQSLTETRDYLLPRLLSGDVRVE